MEIKIGQIINTKHRDDKNKSNIHPYLIINISKKNIYGIQCTSVKKENNQSYFSKKYIDYYELKYTDISYVTHVRLDSFEKIKLQNLREIICDANLEDYKQIYKCLRSIEWKDNKYFNNNEIQKHIKKGLENFNFNKTWTTFDQKDQK